MRGSLTAISPPGAAPRTGGLVPPPREGCRDPDGGEEEKPRRARTAQCRGSRRFWIRRSLGWAGTEDSRRL